MYSEQDIINLLKLKEVQDKLGIKTILYEQSNSTPDLFLLMKWSDDATANRPIYVEVEKKLYNFFEHGHDRLPEGYIHEVWCWERPNRISERFPYRVRVLSEELSELVSNGDFRREYIPFIDYFKREGKKILKELAVKKLSKTRRMIVSKPEFKETLDIEGRQFEISTRDSELFPLLGPVLKGDTPASLECALEDEREYLDRQYDSYDLTRGEAYRDGETYMLHMYESAILNFIVNGIRLGLKDRYGDLIGLTTSFGIRDTYATCLITARQEFTEGEIKQRLGDDYEVIRRGYTDDLFIGNGKAVSRQNLSKTLLQGNVELRELIVS